MKTIAGEDLKAGNAVYVVGSTAYRCDPIMNPIDKPLFIATRDIAKDELVMISMGVKDGELVAEMIDENN